MSLGHQDPDTARWEDDGGAHGCRCPGQCRVESCQAERDAAARQVVAASLEPTIRFAGAPAQPAALPASGDEYRRMISGG